ncbi:MAG: hypothetical protein AAGA85_13990 [Bacteroidota bacterium]
MEANIEVLELIERFHEGKLRGKELEAFQERQKTDSEFAQLVNDLRTTFQTIDAVGRQEFREEVALWETEIASNEQSTSRPVIPLRRWMAVAASVLIVVVPLGYFYFTSQSVNKEELFASNFQPYENLLASRSDEENDSKALDSGLQLYEQENYRAAAEQLEAHASQFPDDLAAKFYLAEARLASNQPNAALGFYQQVAEDPTNAFRELAEWRIALTYLTLASSDPLSQQLNLILQQEGHEYREAAKQLQTELAGGID